MNIFNEDVLKQDKIVESSDEEQIECCRSVPNTSSTSSLLYKEFFDTVYLIPRSQKAMINELERSGIKYNKNYNWSGPLLQNIKILNISHTRTYQIVNFSVQIGPFINQVRILHIFSRALTPNLSLLYFGNSTNIYNFILYNKKYICKSTYFDLNSQKNEAGKRAQLLETIKQFCIAKMMSILKIGPKIIDEFHFDLFVMPTEIIFFMESCLSFNDQQIVDYLHFNITKLDDQIKRQNDKSNDKKQFSQSKFDLKDKIQNQLKVSLLQMHALHLIHRDIKPDNIMYSPQWKKFVFIDFGVSDFNIQKPGQLTSTNFIGTYAYCLQQMKDVLKKQQKQCIDLYLNDAFGLRLSLSEILNIIINEKKPIIQKIDGESFFLQVKLKHHLFSLSSNQLSFNTKNQIAKNSEHSIQSFQFLPISFYRHIMNFLYQIKLTEKHRRFYFEHLDQKLKKDIFFTDIKQLFMFPVFIYQFKQITGCFTFDQKKSKQNCQKFYKQLQTLNKIQKNGLISKQNLTAQLLSVQKVKALQKVKYIQKLIQFLNFFQYGIPLAKKVRACYVYCLINNLNISQLTNKVFIFDKKVLNQQKKMNSINKIKSQISDLQNVTIVFYHIFQSFSFVKDHSLIDGFTILNILIHNLFLVITDHQKLCYQFVKKIKQIVIIIMESKSFRKIQKIEKLLKILEAKSFMRDIFLTDFIYQQIIQLQGILKKQIKLLFQKNLQFSSDFDIYEKNRQNIINQDKDIILDLSQIVMNGISIYMNEQNTVRYDYYRQILKEEPKLSEKYPSLQFFLSYIRMNAIVNLQRVDNLAYLLFDQQVRTFQRISKGFLFISIFPLMNYYQRTYELSKMNNFLLMFDMVIGVEELTESYFIGKRMTLQVWKTYKLKLRQTAKFSICKKPPKKGIYQKISLQKQCFQMHQGISKISDENILKKRYEHYLKKLLPEQQNYINLLKQTEVVKATMSVCQKIFKKTPPELIWYSNQLQSLLVKGFKTYRQNKLKILYMGSDQLVLINLIYYNLQVQIKCFKSYPDNEYKYQFNQSVKESILKSKQKIDLNNPQQREQLLQKTENPLTLYPYTQSFKLLLATDRSSQNPTVQAFLMLFDLLQLNRNKKYPQMISYLESKRQVIIAAFQKPTKYQKYQILTSFSILLYSMELQSDINLQIQSVDFILSIVQRKWSVLNYAQIFQATMIKVLIKCNRLQKVMDWAMNIIGYYHEHLSSQNVLMIAKLFRIVNDFAQNYLQKRYFTQKLKRLIVQISPRRMPIFSIFLLSWVMPYNRLKIVEFTSRSLPFLNFDACQLICCRLYKQMIKLNHLTNRKRKLLIKKDLRYPSLFLQSQESIEQKVSLFLSRSRTPQKFYDGIKQKFRDLIMLCQNYSQFPNKKHHFNAVFNQKKLDHYIRESIFEQWQRQIWGNTVNKTKYIIGKDRTGKKWDKLNKFFKWNLDQKYFQNLIQYNLF